MPREPIISDYFYGDEAEQFSYCRSRRDREAHGRKGQGREKRGEKAGGQACRCARRPRRKSAKTCRSRKIIDRSRMK